MPNYTLKESVQADSNGEFVPVLYEEDSIHEAELLDVQEKLAPWKDRETGEDVYRLEWTFKLDTQRVWGDTPNNFSAHPDCVFRGWVQEILGGAELPKGFNLDTNDLIGSKCRVRLGVRSWKDKNTGKEKSRNFVADVIHARTNAPKVLDEEPF